jgi:hypothetical protein
MGDNWADYPLPNTWARVGSGMNLFFSFISLFSILFALTVFFCTPALRKAHQNYLVLSLMMTCLATVYNAGVHYGHVAISNSYSFLIGANCNLNGFLNGMLCIVEIYTLMCMAIERYFIVVRQRALSRMEMVILLAVGWVEAAFIARYPQEVIQ